MIKATLSAVHPWQTPHIVETVFHGRVVWLTAEQGGRSTGPPTGEEFRATGYVPPNDASNGLASFWLRGLAPGEWKSSAIGWWLAVENAGPQAVQPGSVVVVTEGARDVAYFHVDGVRSDDMSRSASGR